MLRIYDDPVPTAWVLPTGAISSHAVTELTDDGQAIDGVKGNSLLNSPRGKLVLVIQNADDAGSATATPRVSGVLRDGANSFTPVPKGLTVGPGEIGVVGPFSAVYEYDGKVIIDWSFADGAAAGDISVTLVQLP